jgi:hypothetical protein
MKVYNLQNIEYRFSREDRKWRFKAVDTNYELLTVCPGGRETADKVAGQVVGGIKRSKGKGIDGLARKNIENLVSV